MDAEPITLEVPGEQPMLEFRTESKASATWVHQDLAHVKVKVFQGHTDAVKSCQFCDEGRKILSASFDKTIKLWDRETGENVFEYDGEHSLYISQAKANFDTTRIASCGWDKRLNLWNAETGRVLWTAMHEGVITCCDFSHDGKLIVTGSDLDFKIRIWDAHNGDLLKTLPNIHTSTPTSVMFSPKDDRVISTSMDKTTRFYDLKSEQNTITLEGHINIISDASFSRDERKLATTSWDKSIQVWDVSTGMYRSKGPATFEKAHEGCISSCDFSDDGLLLVSGGFDHQVCVWDVENSVQKLRLQGHADWVECVCFSDDQKWVLSSSKDTTVRLWNVENAEKIPLVLERRRAIGINISTCSVCGKPFSVSEGDEGKQKCVFCRLETRDSRASSVTNSEHVSIEEAKTLLDDSSQK